jgi:6-phosphogluconolactonase (cycloisomerase 2 family)
MRSASRSRNPDGESSTTPLAPGRVDFRPRPGPTQLGFSCAEIVVHPSRKFLYASNRGHDTIAMYTVDPTRRFLLAAGQSSGTVSVFGIDEATGRLAFTGTTIDVPSPVSVVFSRTTGR